MQQLAGKKAIVTGGSQGIGKAIVERLSREGAEVTFTYFGGRERAEAMRDQLAADGARAHAVRVDLASVADVVALFDTATATMGDLDIVVTNAAVMNPWPLLADCDEEVYAEVMDGNARGTFFAIRESARRLREGGRIVNISSLDTAVANPGNALYAGSKAAIEQFVAVAAKELGGRGITANTVSPAATDTDRLHAVRSAEVLEHVKTVTPLGRLGTPDDIANVVAFLAGPEGGWITGQNIRATGGLP